jgi:Flp pilus assembly CpaF family ATPase
VQFATTTTFDVIVHRLTLGRHVDEASPIVGNPLPDGSRVNVIIRHLADRPASPSESSPKLRWTT